MTINTLPSLFKKAMGLLETHDIHSKTAAALPSPQPRTGQDQLLRSENPPSGEFSLPSSTLLQHQHPSLSALSTADEDNSLSHRVHTVPGAGLPTHNEATGFNFETSVHEQHLPVELR